MSIQEQNNDISNMIHYVVCNNSSKDSIIKELSNKLNSYNIKRYESFIEYYSNEVWLTVEWIDNHNKTNVCIEPINIERG